MNKISSADRSALIRLASSLPAGDPNRKVILAGLKKAKESVDGLPVVDGGYFWEEVDGGFALMKSSNDERGFIIDGGRAWLSYVPGDESPIGRGQDSASDAAYQLMEHLRIY